MPRKGKNSKIIVKRNLNTKKSPFLQDFKRGPKIDISKVIKRRLKELTLPK